MYSIKFNKGSHVVQGIIQMLLQEKMEKSPFRAIFYSGIDKASNFCIFVKNVRLRKAKPYCGNHPGVCQIIPGRPTKKPNSTYLEWDDWIKFNNLVNSVLNKYKANADVCSLPHDVSGKMFIRKNNKPRLKWDWEEQYINGRMIRVWNQGTPDQFCR